MKQTDSSTPVPRGAWQYYQRTVDGLGYKIHCRQPRGYKAQDIGEEVSPARECDSGLDEPAKVFFKTKDNEPVHPARNSYRYLSRVINWIVTVSTWTIYPQVVLDENELAKANTKSSFTAVDFPRQHLFGILQTAPLKCLIQGACCQVSSLSASPSHELLAYTVDTEGGETFDLVIKRIGGDEISRVEEVDGGIVWGGDDSTIFYLKMDDQHRPFQVGPKNEFGSSYQ